MTVSWHGVFPAAAMHFGYHKSLNLPATKRVWPKS